MYTLAELHKELLNSTELGNMLKSLTKELHNRNVFPLYARAMYSGNDLDDVINNLRLMLQLTDMTTQNTINSDEYQDFRHALWFGDNDGQFDIERSLSILLAYALHRYWPTVDDYVKCLDDTRLVTHLNLSIDDEGLIELTDEIELRKHAIVLPKQDIMIYPHQFLRRFYNSNFVYMPAALEQCRKQGYSVRLRVDPLRQTKPRYYREIFEADHWYGPLFQQKILISKDRKPVRTVHFASKDGRLQITYPLGYTVFRSDMLDETNRQFMIEEYVPLLSPWGNSRSVPGVGNKFVIQKFAHFVYDQTQNSFSHIDGAVRSFTVNEYTAVFESVKTGSNPGKRIGKRRKLFKVSGNLSIEVVQNLLYEYFRYNPHIAEYFASEKQLDSI